MYKHVIADLKNCDPAALVWDESKFALIEEAVNRVSTVLGSRHHVFDNGAYTAVLLLAESHFSIHTWPEHSSCCFDLFTCGDADPLVAATAIAVYLGVPHPEPALFTVISRSY